MSFSIKNSFSIAILGEATIGKSAITCRYVFKKFSKIYTSTIEDIFSKRIIIDDEMAELDILDTAGLEEFRSVKEGKLGERDGFLVVFDLSKKETLDRIDRIYE